MLSCRSFVLLGKGSGTDEMDGVILLIVLTIKGFAYLQLHVRGRPCTYLVTD